MSIWEYSDLEYFFSSTYRLKKDDLKSNLLRKLIHPNAHSGALIDVSGLVLNGLTKHLICYAI